jgi:hypothetical protein
MHSVQEKAQRITGFAEVKKFKTAESNFRRAYVTERTSAKSVLWFTRFKGIESLLKKTPLRKPQN